ncbi:MAG TPA: cell division protein FtsQ/DivIB [Planctomycetaceae bacterium]|jgi:cell division septal protein FtsQ|nr:cell division protein FtsQ/DivIB [Planctomycetaceae bacterium]
MARKKKAPAIESPEPAASSPGLLRSLRRQLYRPALLVAAAALVALACGWPVIHRLMPLLDGRSEYRLRAAQIQITQPPHWVPHNLVEQVIEKADLPAEMSLLDENLARDIAEAFALHPWVEEVVSVTKSFPAMVEVKLNYRRPVAMVQVKQGLYPIDVQGVLLPPQDFSAADAKTYPQILDVLSTPQGPAGSDWGDPVVAEAARLANELAPYWKKLQLAAIICPRAQKRTDSLDEGIYTLTTTGGSQIIWGHGPGSDHPGELSTEQKIERLEKYASQYRGLDQPNQRFRIDIRHWRDIRRSPLSADRDSGDELPR